MSDFSTRAIDWLESLIAFDTRNGIGDEIPCAKFLQAALATHNPDTLYLGTTPRSRGRSDGAYILAIWGTPQILLNVHFDTVPSGEGWSADPHIMRREGERLIGLGASDIKGAIACVLAGLEQVTPHNVAVLFSGDEEQGSEVMRDIIERAKLPDVPRAIICEPTGCEIGQRHRGFISYAVHFDGPGGHSSLSDKTAAPVLDAARLGTALGEYGADNLAIGPTGYKGLCVNIGMIESDGAHNVIPSRAELRFSLRPPPGDDIAIRVTDIENISSKIMPQNKGGMSVQQMTAFPPFGVRDLAGFAPYFQGQEKHPIDLPYWTEAAMLSEAGIDCVVYGPGDVAQAHKADEFVTITQLETAGKVYMRALAGQMAGQS